MSLEPLDPREQPRCATCGHRRIYHYVAKGKSRREMHETPIRCGNWIETGKQCPCTTYQPRRDTFTPSQAV